MTRRLILMRHAKSDWSHGLADHDRPLNARGMAQAPLIGKWLAAKGYVPQVVLCSDATRTRQTLDRAMSEMPTGVQVFHLAALYLADPRAILDQLYRQTAETIAIVGHNPGIGQLAANLARTPPDHHRFYDYPTGAVTVLEFDLDDWRGIGAHSGTVVDFVIPADL